jgi:rhodanese-related sulfurtransferase
MTLKDGWATLVADARTRIHECSVEELEGLLAQGELTLVDVREPVEYAAGHLPGAISIPRGVVELKLPELVADPQALVVCYCGSGGRSALSSDSLQRIGYQNVLSLRGGYQAWSAGGKPLQQD